MIIAWCKFAAKGLLLLLATAALIYLLYEYIRWKMTNALQAGCNSAIDYVAQNPDSLASDQEVIHLLTSSAFKADSIAMHYWKLSDDFSPEAPFWHDSEIRIYDNTHFNIEITRDMSGKVVSVSFNEGRIVTQLPAEFLDMTNTRYPYGRFDIETTANLSEPRSPVALPPLALLVALTLICGITMYFLVRDEGRTVAVRLAPSKLWAKNNPSVPRNTLLMSK